MIKQFTGCLWDFGGDEQRHHVTFTLAYDGHTRAHITFWVEGPSPAEADLATAFAPLLDRLSEVAQQAAASPQMLSWPDQPLHKDKSRT